MVNRSLRKLRVVCSRKFIPVVILLLIFTGILAVPAFLATIPVDIVKFASDGKSVLADNTLTYRQMREILPVLCDGITYYSHKGPVFAKDPNEAAGQQIRADSKEDSGFLAKNMGTLMGTNLKDLMHLVGGMTSDDTVDLPSSDVWAREFAYESVYKYSPREGAMVYEWNTDSDSAPATTGVNPDNGYAEGIQLIRLTGDRVNPQGVYAISKWDWHDAASSLIWYYYSSGADRYPVTTGLSGKNITEIRIHSNRAVPPVAAFSALPLTGSCPFSVQFVDQSTGTGISARTWDFQNDGIVDSVEQDPLFVYDTPGTYTVNLTIVTTDTADEEVKAGYITVTNPAGLPPVARVYGGPVIGEIPLTVQFTDYSSQNATSWDWNFGDGTTSGLRNPNHTYTAEGTYTITLTAANDFGSDRETKLNYVSARSLRWGPYLTNTTSTSTMVNVRTFSPAMVTVEFASDEFFSDHSTYDRQTTEEVSTLLHHIVLTGLSPDTVYHYRIVYGTQTTGDLHFRTFPESGPFAFVVYSDTQDQLPAFSQLERHKLVADRIAAEPDVLFVLNSGDLVNDAADMDNWDRYFAAGGTMMAAIPVFPALGNHDNYDTNYFEAYGLSPNYSFDCADAHVSVLDSNYRTDLITQAEWLADDLRTEKPFRFVSFHHPPFSSDPKHFSGFRNIREAWEDRFTNNSVLAVFNGHVHAYERFVTGSVNYFVQGIGGAPSYLLQTPRAEGSVRSFENIIGYTRVTVDPAGGTATAEVIQVADVSGGIVTLSPPNTVIDTVVMFRPRLPLSIR